MCRLYVAICNRWGPRIDGKRVTVSAWAFWHAKETGDTWLRDRIDGAFLFWRSQHNHCQAQYQMETKQS